MTPPADGEDGVGALGAVGREPVVNLSQAIERFARLAGRDAPGEDLSAAGTQRERRGLGVAVEDRAVGDQEGAAREVEPIEDVADPPQQVPRGVDGVPTRAGVDDAGDIGAEVGDGRRIDARTLAHRVQAAVGGERAGCAALDGGDDLLDQFADFELVGVDGQVGERVEGLALRLERLDASARVGAGQQRADLGAGLLGLGVAREDRGGPGLERDYETAGGKLGAVRGIEPEAAAGRDHGPFDPCGLAGGGAFALTEAGFAVLLEDCGDRASGLALDLVVEVDCAPAETLGDVGREHRLAGRAEADQHDPAELRGKFRR